MKINTWIKLGLAYLCILLMATCATGEYSEDPGTEIPPVDPFKEGSVPIKVPITRAVNDNDPENRIESVRLVIIRQNVVTNNKMLGNLSSITNIQLTDIAPVGYVDLFVIVNELPVWNLGGIQINDILSPNVLKNKVLSFNSGYPVVNASHPIPMFRMYENLRIMLNGETLLNNVPVLLSSVERLYAKVTFELNCTFADLDNGGDPIEIKHVLLKSMPKESYLAPAQYTKSSPSDFFDGGVLAMKADSNYTWNSNQFNSDFVCYIPEYLVSDISRYVYVSAVVNLTADETAEKEYKIAIGDGIAKGNDHMLGSTRLYSDVRISRNTHYHFTGNIRSFDLSANQDIEIHPQIVAWGEAIVDYDPREYLLQVSQNEFTFPSTAGLVQGVIHVVTDHPQGWSAVVAKGVPANSTTLVGSYSGAPSGDLTLTASGTITVADTIKVTAGKVTKHILVKNN
ncbi:MAG: hypothetical protein LBK65_02905 [Tannerellaceae bacterium]|jgi:hypothetical protein|nr:hypothetical protein [Tannerellaceae bacterium]